MRSFLVIRRDNIGDLVCTTPLFAVLKTRFPDARLCALVNTYNRAVLDGNPLIDAVYALPSHEEKRPGQNLRARLAENMAALSRLRKERFECVIQASRSTRRKDKVLGYLAGCRHYLTRCHDPDTGHEVVRTLSVLNGIGLYPQPAAPCVYPDPTAVARTRALLERSPAGPAPTAIHLSARSPEKRWPLERYLEFLQKAVALGGRFVVLWAPGPKSQPGHPGDDDRAATLSKELVGLPVTFFRTDMVADLMAVLAASSNLIACDGGHCHLAAALRVPVLGLYCNRFINDWRPWGGVHRIVGAASVPEITVDKVLGAFLELPRAVGDQGIGY